jgi:4-alpha-glucanotransferase
MTTHFYLRFYTTFGQTLYVTGNCSALGDYDQNKAIPLKYLNDQFCHCEIEIPDIDIESGNIEYYYILKDTTGDPIAEWKDNKQIECARKDMGELILVDTWNFAGTIENAFYTKPFKEVLLKQPATTTVIDKSADKYTHEFKVKCPLLKTNEVICITGSGKVFGDWDVSSPLLLTKQEDWWTVGVNISNGGFPLSYKYGIYDVAEKTFVRFEAGDNRLLPGDGGIRKYTILHDGFVRIASPNWKGAGVAIPVFSLRSENSFGTGEFTDIKLLVDWAKETGLKLIQLLPVNDTTATHTWTESYPYAAVSAFGLHPLFLNLSKVAGDKNSAIIKSLKQKQKELNGLADVDYEEVMKYKFATIKRLYQDQKEEFSNDIKYFEFFDLNRHWLVPYAVFCYLRDEYKTADYNTWPAYSVFKDDEIQELASPDQPHYDGVALHYFIQYHLHLQLKAATLYAHNNGIVVKGDLPIGIYRYSCDAWMAPDLYNMDAQAGAPPDDFAVKGQNWGFPTYNWKKMQEDGFAWWRQRFEQMSEYFDVFRIDHILGFFRIWSIPLDAVEGILGHFVPAIPVHINELFQNNISFQYHRYCKPYITEYVLQEKFREQTAFVKENFLTPADGFYELKPAFDTQRKVEDYFSHLPATDFTQLIQGGLFDLISNVIFIEEPGSQMQQFHFRIGMDSTTSFRDLDDYSKQKLKDLYVNYFFRRQDDFWRRQAMQKLPELKRSTDMLVCGEDLGMVPTCVPDVMRQLGMLSLEIQRMPKQTTDVFFHPVNAPYLSVVTPSTHDMSTIRGWWEENQAKTQQFYNNMLGHYGAAPFYCEPYINKEIILQHIYSPAMWSIFQLQDILGSSEKLRRNNPNQERINIPANPKHYWKYRMHLTLEDLVKEKGFNEDFKKDVVASGR